MELVVGCCKALAPYPYLPQIVRLSVSLGGLHNAEEVG